MSPSTYIKIVILFEMLNAVACLYRLSVPELSIYNEPKPAWKTAMELLSSAVFAIIGAYIIWGAK